jgi:hypothetical protein
MTEINERIADERRRLREVRQTMTAAVEQQAHGDSSFVPFYIAIGDYFEATMARLHRQDVRMGDMLRDKADLDDPDHLKALAELGERLSGNQEHLQQLLAAREQLKSSGDEALQIFETAGGAYSDYIVSNMGHHPGSTQLAASLFTQEDWAYMADISAEDQALEAQLFAQVFSSVPAALTRPQAD